MNEPEEEKTQAFAKELRELHSAFLSIRMATKSTRVRGFGENLPRAYRRLQVCIGTHLFVIFVASPSWVGCGGAAPSLLVVLG
jgi:hypothetical protein